LWAAGSHFVGTGTLVSGIERECVECRNDVLYPYIGLALFLLGIVDEIENSLLSQILF